MVKIGDKVRNIEMGYDGWFVGMSDDNPGYGYMECSGKQGWAHGSLPSHLWSWEPKGGNTYWGVDISNLEVLTEEKTRIKGFKRGDKVRLKSFGRGIGPYSDGPQIGDVFTVKKVIDKKYVEFEEKGRHINKVNEEGLELEKEATPNALPKQKGFKTGDKVRIVGNHNHHEYKIGEEVFLLHQYNETKWHSSRKKGGKMSNRGVLRAEDIELVIEPEAVVSEDAVLPTLENNEKETMSIENQILEQVIKEIETNPKVDKSILKSLEKLGVVPNKTELIIKKTPKSKGIEVKDQHFMFETILKAIAAHANVALVGPAGGGKTTIVHKCADVLELPFYSKSVSAQTSIYEFFGYMDANGKYVGTLFREAYEKGGVFLLDEFDAGNPNVLASINQATANGSCAFPDKMVEKHKDFIIVMAGNTYGTGATMEYVGRNKIDAATLDRFAFIELPYDEALEKSIVSDKEWCEYVQKVRKKAEQKKVKAIISPRASIMGSSLLAQGIDKEAVKKMTLFKGLSEEEIKLIDIK